MKIIISVLLSLFLTTTLFAQTQFAALQFSPEKPQQNQELSFDYNQAYSSLIRKSPIDVAIYEFTSTGIKVLEPKMVKKAIIILLKYLLTAIRMPLHFYLAVKRIKILMPIKAISYRYTTTMASPYRNITAPGVIYMRYGVKAF